MASSNRKISVIMVADVGYSKHMEVDEDATLASYKECEAGILKDLLKNITDQFLIQEGTQF